MNMQALSPHMMEQGVVVVDGLVFLDVADQLVKQGDQGRQIESRRRPEEGIEEVGEVLQAELVHMLQEQCCLQED